MALGAKPPIPHREPEPQNPGGLREEGPYIPSLGKAVRQEELIRMARQVDIVTPTLTVTHVNLLTQSVLTASYGIITCQLPFILTAMPLTTHGSQMATC